MYLGRSGPSYETPAEVIAFRAMGADAVGMSTVPGCITAVQCGMKICVISLTLGVLTEDFPPITHEWVCKTIQEMIPDFMKFIQPFIRLL